MMPSRGIRLARIKPPRVHQAQCRDLSSTSRPTFRIATIKPSLASRCINPWSKSIPALLPPVAAIRHASTVPAPSPAAAGAATPTPSASGSASFSSIDTISLDTLDQAGKSVDPSSLSEGIGYLHSLGINYGIGPTSVIQSILEHIHVWGGVPWWASIILTSMSLRLVLFPMFLKSSDNQARQIALSPVTQPFMDRVSKAREEGDLDELKRVYAQLRAVRQRAGISYTTQLAPMALQGVLGFCGFRLMIALADLPVPGFKDGGFLWMPDLTLTDGYLITPFLMSAAMHITMRLGGETGATAAPVGMRNFLMYVMPVIIFGFTAFQSGAVALWFAGSGAVGLAQARILQSSRAREYFGLAPLWKPKPGETSSPLEQLLGRSWSQAQDGVGAGDKSAASTRPTYQAPRNISSQNNGRMIDTKLVGAKESTIDMVQPTSPVPGKSFIDGLREKFNNAKANALKRSQKTPEQLAAQARKDFKKRAEQYEQRAAQKKKI